MGRRFAKLSACDLPHWGCLEEKGDSRVDLRVLLRVLLSNKPLDLTRQSLEREFYEHLTTKVP